MIWLGAVMVALAVADLSGNDAYGWLVMGVLVIVFAMWPGGEMDE